MKPEIIVLMYVRNEEVYLGRCLDYLSTQGVKVAVLDNESTDATADILAASSPNLVIRHQRHPFNGTFDLTSIMQGLEDMQKTLRADWFVLNSPDEVLQSDRPGERMCDALQRVDASGYNVINFDEFVFLPEDHQTSYEGRDFLREMRRYYFFAPAPLRSMRAWKNLPNLRNPSGHRVTGTNIRRYPASFVHRHYVTLSWSHFRRTYGSRSYAPGDLAKNWHVNRVDIDFEQTRFPPANRLKRLPQDGQPCEFDRSEPWTEHFWCRKSQDG